MSNSQSVAGIVFSVFLTASTGAQSPTSSGRAPSKTHTTNVVVRDVSGTPIADTTVTITGPGRNEVATNARGTAVVMLPDGSYRLRLQHDGFITLERDVTIRNGQPAEIEIALNRAVTPAAPPRPPIPAAPVPSPRSSGLAPVAAGPPVNISLPAFLEKNFIGREPLKESILRCTPDGTIRLLQLRDPVAVHTHAASDEILYVVAGDGAIRIGDESTAITPGFLSVIPRGTSHAIERRGKNPLILLSTIAGVPCSATSSGP
jgi:mannose-6-phosphate isomerase-like protein (cupin superfamily)